MATTYPARTSIAISANPGDETVQTQQNAEIDREAARTSLEVRQGSQGQRRTGVWCFGLKNHPSKFTTHPTTTAAAFRPSTAAKYQPPPRGSIPPKSRSGHNDPLYHVPAAIGSLEDSDQRRVLPHEHPRQEIFRRDQLDGPGRRGSSALADIGHKPGHFHAGWFFAAA